MDHAHDRVTENEHICGAAIPPAPTSRKGLPMFAVTFVLVAILADGTELELFRWTRDRESGLARARREAVEFFGEAWLAGVTIEARAV